jgi:hypothetical protein
MSLTTVMAERNSTKKLSKGFCQTNVVPVPVKTRTNTTKNGCHHNLGIDDGSQTN